MVSGIQDFKIKREFQQKKENNEHQSKSSKVLSYKIDPSELKLVDACLQKQRSAQKALYDKYKDSMYTILCRMLNNEEEAADSLQDAFIQVFRSLHSFKKISSLGAWIKTIVVRTGLSKQRKFKRFENVEIKEDSTNENQVIIWDENLTGDYLEKAIQGLPEGYRNVFLLIEVEGYKHREVAEMLGISEGTSKSQLFHSKKMLQKILKELMY